MPGPTTTTSNSHRAIEARVRRAYAVQGLKLIRFRQGPYCVTNAAGEVIIVARPLVELAAELGVLDHDRRRSPKQEQRACA